MTTLTNATVLADSVPAVGGERLTTFLLRYPRIVHSEFMTHRMLSRSSASSRAVPTEQVIAKLLRGERFVPHYWGAKQPGMVAHKTISRSKAVLARWCWLLAMYAAIAAAKILLRLNVHKQLASRLLEPFTYIEVVATGTDTAWKAFLALRLPVNAQPEIRELAYEIKTALDGSQPEPLGIKEWHMPFADNLIQATARCARVSYRRQGVESTMMQDEILHDKLMLDRHWSPFEHCAGVYPGSGEGNGNFSAPWVQYRKLVEV